MGKRRTVPRRKRVFVGCEGESEQSYVQFLYDLIREKGLNFHLEVVLLQPGSGDAMACVRKALRERQRRTSRGDFVASFLFLDSDRAGDRPLIDAHCSDNEIKIVWQIPCFEAFLLRHWVGHESDSPANCSLAKIALTKLWPNYRKNTAKIVLAKFFSKEHVLRAATITPGLAVFLTAMGLTS